MEVMLAYDRKPCSGGRARGAPKGSRLINGLR